MTTPRLRDLLDDVAAEASDGLDVDPAHAWDLGVRRRARRRLGAGLGLGLVVVLIGALVLVAPFSSPPRAVDPASGQVDPAVHQYPQRLDKPFWEATLPAISGPLAGIVERVTHRSGVDYWKGWYAVSPTGHLWRLDTNDGENPSISPDGTHLAYMRGNDPHTSPLVITDQVTGDVVTFPQIGTGSTDPDHPEITRGVRYFFQPQEPMFWSPDGTAALLQIGSLPYNTAGPVAGIAHTDGTLQVIDPKAGLPERSYPIGWLDNHTIGLAAIGHGHSAIVALDVDTDRVVGRAALTPNPRGWSQWTASLSPDGSQVMTFDDPGDGTTDAPIRFHYALTGGPAGALRVSMPDPGHDSLCPPSWSSTEAYVAVDDTGLVRVNGGTVIAADPRLGVRCSVWARSALDGGPHQGIGGRIFGTRSTWLSWHWRELSIGVLIASTAGGLVVWRRRRRTARRALP